MDVNQLLESVILTKSSKVCWATALDGDGARFIEGVRDLVMQGKTISYTIVAETLSTHFHVERTVSSIRHHCKGVCSCNKTK